MPPAIEFVTYASIPGIKKEYADPKIERLEKTLKSRGITDDPLLGHLPSYLQAARRSGLIVAENRPSLSEFALKDVDFQVDLKSIYKDEEVLFAGILFRFFSSNSFLDVKIMKKAIIKQIQASLAQQTQS